MLERARELRAKQTPAETTFWELVRNRRFMGLKFRRQHQIGDYIPDFYCQDCKLVVELDGKIHEKLQEKDKKRDAWLQSLGLTVLRFRNEELMQDTESVFNAIAEAVPLMQQKHEALRDFFNGFDYSGFFAGTESDQLRAVSAGADYVFEQEDGKRRFMQMVASLSKAFALSVPREEAEAIRDDLAFFQAVRAAIRKRLADDEPPPPPDARAAVRQVLSGAVASDGVIDLFQAAGLPQQNVGILSDEFLDRLAALPHRNLALETLRKLLNDQIRSREKVNIVQSRGFREALESTLTQYTNRALTTAQVIDELIGLAKTIRQAMDRGEKLGLREDEEAFYDALADNQSAREVMQDDTLKLIARQLAERIKSKTSLDWTQRETVRADMRRTVRRLLTKYGYPPDAQENATQLVIKQAELMAEGIVQG